MTTKSKAQPGERLDEEIARDVRQSLKLDSEVPDDRIKVSVDGGRVTLEGFADKSLEKEAAETDARKVKGVRAVINRIEV